LLGVGFLFGEIDIGLDVAGKRSELIVGGELFFGALALAQDLLRCFLIIPKGGIGDARFEGLQALAVLGNVKDNSGRVRCGASGLRSGAANLRES
jgi:hypothetical protein